VLVDPKEMTCDYVDLAYVSSFPSFEFPFGLLVIGYCFRFVVIRWKCRSV